jgi:hypothetical protein
MKKPPLNALPGLLPALALLLLGGGPVALAAPEAIPVALRTLKAARLEGELVGMDAKGVTLRGGASAEQRVPLDEIVALTFPVRPPRRVAGPRFRALLVGGGEVVASLAGGDSDTLTVESASLGRLPLILDIVRTLEAMPAKDDPCHDLADKHPRPEKGDVAFDATGDEYRGTALEVTKEAVLIETQGKRERSVPWSSLRVLHLENDLLEPSSGRQTEVELQDGSRVVTAGDVRLADGTLHFALRSLPKHPVTVALADVRAVRFTGGRFVYASDLPFKSEQKPYHEDPPEARIGAFTNRWVGLRVDRRSSGCPLRLAGTTYRHGFGVNSHNVITLALNGAYESFRAHFGIDDEARLKHTPGSGTGNVDARILADGKVVWEAKGVKGGAKPLAVGPLKLSGVKTLVLEVGFGKEMMTRDRASWCDPILVKTTK